MLWFDGPIRNAIEKVKSSGSFLLVFVQGEDSLSKKYETYLNEETKFKPQSYVALKISHDSVALQQFKQIYVKVPIPSVFLIQNNGIPIKIVSSDKPSDINSAISDAVKNCKVEAKEGKEIKMKENKVPVNYKKSLNDIRPEIKQHVKNIGQKLFEISEEELQQRLNEIRAFPKFLVLGQPVETCSSPTPRIHSARIQFRLPNNSMPSWEFPELSTLGDVKAYLMEKMQMSSNFKLLRTYPRTAFTPQDEDKTLVELSLIPNATLIVVPVEDKRIQAKVKNQIMEQNFVSAIVSTLLKPLFAFFDYLKKHVLRIPERTQTEPRRLVSETSVENLLNKKTSTSNIHGFKFEDDADSDSEHPDNGNSTQQRYHKK